MENDRSPGQMKLRKEAPAVKEHLRQTLDELEGAEARRSSSFLTDDVDWTAAATELDHLIAEVGDGSPAPVRRNAGAAAAAAPSKRSAGGAEKASDGSGEQNSKLQMMDFNLQLDLDDVESLILQPGEGNDHNGLLSLDDDSVEVAVRNGNRNSTAFDRQMRQLDALDFDLGVERESDEDAAETASEAQSEPARLNVVKADHGEAEQNARVMEEKGKAEASPAPQRSEIDPPAPSSKAVGKVVKMAGFCGHCGFAYSDASLACPSCKEPRRVEDSPLLDSRMSSASSSEDEDVASVEPCYCGRCGEKYYADELAERASPDLCEECMRKAERTRGKSLAPHELDASYIGCQRCGRDLALQQRKQGTFMCVACTAVSAATAEPKGRESSRLSGAVIMLSPAVQLATVMNLMSRKPAPGERWFVISSEWFEFWKQYVTTPDGRLPPSQIDNTFVLQRDHTAENSGSEEEREVRPGLTEGSDYVMVPEAAWQLLHTWYGGGPSIARTVDSDGVVSARLRVSVTVFLCNSVGLVENETARTVLVNPHSRPRQVKGQLGLSEGSVRMFLLRSNGCCKYLAPQNTLCYSGVKDGSRIAVQRPSMDDVWPNPPGILEGRIANDAEDVSFAFPGLDAKNVELSPRERLSQRASSSESRSGRQGSRKLSRFASWSKDTFAAVGHHGAKAQRRRRSAGDDAAGAPPADQVTAVNPVFGAPPEKVEEAQRRASRAGSESKGKTEAGASAAEARTSGAKNEEPVVRPLHLPRGKSLGSFKSFLSKGRSPRSNSNNNNDGGERAAPPKSARGKRHKSPRAELLSMSSDSAVNAPFPGIALKQPDVDPFPGIAVYDALVSPRDAALLKPPRTNANTQQRTGLFSNLRNRLKSPRAGGGGGRSGKSPRKSPRVRAASKSMGPGGEEEKQQRGADDKQSLYTSIRNKMKKSPRGARGGGGDARRSRGLRRGGSSKVNVREEQPEVEQQPTAAAVEDSKQAVTDLTPPGSMADLFVAPAPVEKTEDLAAKKESGADEAKGANVDVGDAKNNNEDDEDESLSFGETVAEVRRSITLDEKVVATEVREVAGDTVTIEREEERTTIITAAEVMAAKKEMEREENGEKNEDEVEAKKEEGRKNEKQASNAQDTPSSAALLNLDEDSSEPVELEPSGPRLVMSPRAAHLEEEDEEEESSISTSVTTTPRTKSGMLINSFVMSPRSVTPLGSSAKNARLPSSTSKSPRSPRSPRNRNTIGSQNALQELESSSPRDPIRTESFVEKAHLARDMSIDLDIAASAEKLAGPPEDKRRERPPRFFKPAEKRSTRTLIALAEDNMTDRERRRAERKARLAKVDQAAALRLPSDASIQIEDVRQVISESQEIAQLAKRSSFEKRMEEREKRRAERAHMRDSLMKTHMEASDAPPSPVPNDGGAEVINSTSTTTVPYSELKGRAIFFVGQLDTTTLEIYLADKEFEEVFGMTKAQFAKIPYGKQTTMRIDKDLF